MKKLFSIVLTCAMIFSLAACGRSNSGDDGSIASEENSTFSEPETTMDSEDLIVYFSWSGNTESVANEIANQTGAKIFEIIPAEPYTDDYDALLDIAQEEQAHDARPEIAKPLRTLNDMM